MLKHDYYGYLELKSQNLTDQASRLEKMLQDCARYNGNFSLAEGNEGKPESIEGEVFEESSQSAYQNNVPWQAENANFANSVNLDLHTSVIDADVVHQASNEVNQSTSPRDFKIQHGERKAQFNQIYPITRFFSMKSRQNMGQYQSRELL